MDGLRATVKQRKLVFGTTGDVAEVTGATEQLKGKWTAESTEKDNAIRYTLDGQSQEPLRAVYQFTKRNQLQVAVVVDGTPVKAFTFPGRIEIDSNHNFKYFVINASGADTGASFVLYGDFRFAEDTMNLTVSLTGGGEASVTGASGVQSLEAAKNHAAGFTADDLLTFHAKTINVFEGVPEPVTKPAILDFVGRWDLQEGTLVFVSQVKSSPGSREVSLGFAGKFKAVTAGFVYFADASGTKAVLNLRGQHVFKGGAGDLSWRTTIGFSGVAFDAQVAVKAFVPLPSGQSFSLDGSLSLKGAKNKNVAFDLSLQARYEFQSGFLVFKADIRDGIQPSYDLMLGGQFKYSNLDLAFQIAYTNAANAKRLVVSVGVQGNRESMIKHLALLLDISESDAKLKLDLSIEARIVFKNGVRVKEIPA